MIKMSEKSKNFIQKHLPELGDTNEPNEILGPLYDLIVEKGFVSFDKGYNDFGSEAQEVYDDIYYKNYED